MSKYTNNGNQTAAGQTLLDLKTEIAAGGSNYQNQVVTGNMLGMEGFSETQHHSAAANSIQGAIRTLKDTYASLGVEGFSETNFEAGAIAMMAAGNPVEYHRVAMEGRAKEANGIATVDPVLGGPAGWMDYQPEMTVSQEAFDERELRNHLPFSVAWNVQASRQDEFSEAFYPTSVFTPDQVGLDLSARRILVFDEVKRSMTGAVSNFDKKNLLDAYRDYKILENESTTLVPYAHPDGSNAEYFVDEALVGTTTTAIDRTAVPTRPLKFGAKLDLLAISQHPALVSSGVMDQTDNVDARIQLVKVYVKVTDKDAAVSDVICFNVERHGRTLFLKTVEGDFQLMGIQYRTTSLVLDGKTLNNSGVVAPALASLVAGNYRVYLETKVDGDINVELGSTDVYCSGVSVNEVFDGSGQKVSTVSGAGKALVDNLTFEPLGYALSARRTNSNRRTRGKMLDNNVQTERHTIQTGSPMSISMPVTEQEEAAALEALVNATRIRNSNQAVTALLNYADALKNLASSDARTNRDLAIEGIGRWMVHPFFEEAEIDLLKDVNVLTSTDRTGDVMAALCDKIRDIAYRMVRDSGYLPALQVMSAGADVKPYLQIGTDVILPQYLMTRGDLRTFGIGMTHDVKATQDVRMNDTIVMTLKREGQTGPDPLSYGLHAWIPELASVVNVNRNGATVKELMVQPRNRHIHCLPIMAILKVKNLQQVLGKKADLAVTNTQTNP